MEPGIEFAQELPGSPDARFCRHQYFAELSRRFDAGFDPRRGDPSDDADLAPPSGLFIIARIEGNPVGCGGIKGLSAGIAEIKRVWTAPQTRGRGVASALVRHLEEAARARGFSVLRLDTNRNLAEARALYLKAGYREIPRYNDNPYAHHWFEKVL